MNKLIFCFWQEALKERWEKQQSPLSLHQCMEFSANALRLSILRAKKEGFQAVLYTDVEQAYAFQSLPLDQLSTEIELLDYSGRSWIAAKMMVLSRQHEPFVFIDWCFQWSEQGFAEKIRNFKGDCLVAQRYARNLSGDFFFNHDPFLDSIDFSGHYVEGIFPIRYHAYDCRVIGFNNLELRDIYIENFLKCYQVMKRTKWIIDSRVLVEEYLLYIITQSQSSAMETLLPDREAEEHFNMEKPPYDQFDIRSMLTSGEQLHHIAQQLKGEFPEFSVWPDQRQPVASPVKISLCTVVMNRRDHLISTLEKNLMVIQKFGQAVDLNVINYNSQDGLEEYLFEQPWFIDALDRGLLKYFSNYTAEHYHRTLPKNVVHFMAEGAYLINLDADNFIKESFLSFCLATIEHERNFFLRPSYYGDRGVFGRIMIHRDDFKEIGGYNLKIANWGFEDVEITFRLRKLGLRQLMVPYHLCQDAIEHSDEMRIANEEGGEENTFDLAKSRNRGVGFELYPNKNETIDLEVYQFNHLKEKTLLNDTRSLVSL